MAVLEEKELYNYFVAFCETGLYVYYRKDCTNYIVLTYNVVVSPFGEEDILFFLLIPLVSALV